MFNAEDVENLASLLNKDALELGSMLKKDENKVVSFVLGGVKGMDSVQINDLIKNAPNDEVRNGLRDILNKR